MDPTATPTLHRCPRRRHFPAVSLRQVGHGRASVMCHLHHRCACEGGTLGAGVGEGMHQNLEYGEESEQGVQAVLEGGGADDEEAFVGPLCGGVKSRIEYGG